MEDFLPPRERRGSSAFAVGDWFSHFRPTDISRVDCPGAEIKKIENYRVVDVGSLLLRREYIYRRV